MLALLTGANFPLTMLPSGIRFISYCLPLTRSIEAVNRMVLGEDLDTIWSLIAMEAVVGMLYILVSYLLLKRVEKLAIRKGVLEIF